MYWHHNQSRAAHTGSCAYWMGYVVFIVESVIWGCFKNAYELTNLGTLKLSPVNKLFSLSVRFFVWYLKGNLWNSLHWKMWFLYTVENLRPLRFKKRPRWISCRYQIVLIWKVIWLAFRQHCRTGRLFYVCKPGQQSDIRNTYHNVKYDTTTRNMWRKT